MKTPFRPVYAPQNDFGPRFRTSGLFGLTLFSALLAAASPGCTAPDGGGRSSENGDGDGDLNPGDGDSVQPGDGDIGNVGNPPNGGDIVQPNCTANCLDFPEAPLFDPDSLEPVSAADAEAFDSLPGITQGSLCVTEPQLGGGDSPGSLFPANWLRPRFRWEGGAGTVYQIRLSNEIQTHDLVAYTKNKTWTMPDEVWARVAQNTHTPITVTILGDDGTGASGTFQIAPVNARGSMVFWATNTKKVSKDGSYLLGFTIGSENVAPALDLNQTVQQTADSGVSDNRAITNSDGQSIRDETSDPNKPGHLPGEVNCIGCHVSTPDGDAVVFVDDWPWGKVAANVDPETGAVGAEPDYVSDAGTALLRMPFQGTPTMSPAEWGPGNRIMVTSLADRTDQIYFDAGVTWSGANLIWMNLESDAEIEPYRGDDPYNAAQTRSAAILAAEGTAWGYLTLSGETYEAAVTPDWSHDGTRVAYTATNDADNGHPSKTSSSVPADIHIVEYNDGAGGEVLALPGASDETAKEYYPSFSSDDAFIAFNRAASGAPYYNSGSEIHVISSDGGAPLRLTANDPPACTGEASPGITNSWAKWAPTQISHEGKTYYFLVFSSARAHAGQFTMDDPWSPGTPPQKSAQLYMSMMVVDDASGDIQDYPAVYLWNQNRVVIDEVLTPTPSSNLTPAWDTFKIPPPPIVR